MASPSLPLTPGVLDEWLQFLEDASANVAVRPVILASWRRSHAAGVEPRIEAFAVQAVDRVQLERATVSNAELIELARPHLLWLAAEQTAVRQVAILVNRDGIVLASTGDEAMTAAIATPGFDRSETAVGTTAVGIALATGQSATVQGAEHFAAALHPLSSTAAPVRGPSCEIVGAIELCVEHPSITPGYGRLMEHAAFAIGSAWHAGKSPRASNGSSAHDDHLAEELRESKARFRGAFDQAAIAMAITHPDGRWIRVNRALCDLLGYGETDLMEIPFPSITHPEDVTGNLALFRRALAGEIDGYQMEKRYLHREGHAIWTALNVALVRDAGGAPMYFIAQMQDIRERKRAEALLRESEMRYRGLSAAAPVGIFQSDGQGGITYANPRILQIFALSEAEGLGHGWASRIHPDDAEAVIMGWGAALREKREYEHEYRLLLPDGAIRWVRCRAAPLQGSEGELLGTVGTVEDITARKVLEAQLRQAQKMEAVGQLAGGVAHDFNNLLTIIKVHAELAVETLDPAQPLHADLEEIRRAASRAAGLTRQLLAFSRKQVLQPRLLDLRDVISGLAPMLERLIGEDIEVVTRIGASLGSVRADPGQLEQVLVNLAVNARDAMPSGGTLVLAAADLEVRSHDRFWREGVPAGRHVVLSVADSGCGMTREVKERIFEPFFTTKPVGQGTGLGLSMVYGIVDQSGGHLVVESEPGRGTVFSICLPSIAGCETGSPGDAEASACPAGGETVLVVEDEAGVRALARRILERQGYTVLDARDGRHALEFADAYPERIDLLLTDMVMPELNGRLLAERLRVARPDIRVLYMSGYTDDEIVRRGMLDSGVGFVEKPFTADGLSRAVRAALDRAVASPG